MVALIFTLALLLARAQDRTVSAMREGAPAVKAWGARILLLVGVWFLALAVFAEPLADVFPV